MSKSGTEPRRLAPFPMRFAEPGSLIELRGTYDPERQVIVGAIDNHVERTTTSQMTTNETATGGTHDTDTETDSIPDND